MLPVRRVGGDDVEVAVDQQGGPGLVLAFETGDDAGPPGVRFQDLRLEADVREEGGDVLGGLPLTGAGVVAGVRGVDPDQVAADVDDLVQCGGLVRCHGFIVPPGSARVPGRPRLGS